MGLWSLQSLMMIERMQTSWAAIYPNSPYFFLLQLSKAKHDLNYSILKILEHIQSGKYCSHSVQRCRARNVTTWLSLVPRKMALESPFQFRFSISAPTSGCRLHEGPLLVLGLEGIERFWLHCESHSQSKQVLHLQGALKVQNKYLLSGTRLHHHSESPPRKVGPLQRYIKGVRIYLSLRRSNIVKICYTT